LEKYRIICHIQNDEMTILVLRIGMRDKVYKL
jgi:mRNA-degrading endonuclease RelE of RelBE toxin-antitoxin system